MPAHETLSLWESFYVIVGSSAGALTGLQFVVMALVSESDAGGGKGEVAAFGTPTVVHFCIVLLISAVISAPWPGLGGPATLVGLCGAFGIVYSTIVASRARRTTVYRAVLEDWIWHVVLPLAAYTTLVVAAANLTGHATQALFAIAACSILLVFVGIHNAWDTVTWVTVDSLAGRRSIATAKDGQGAPASAQPASVQAPGAQSPATQLSAAQSPATRP